MAFDRIFGHGSPPSARMTTFGDPGTNWHSSFPRTRESMADDRMTHCRLAGHDVVPRSPSPYAAIGSATSSAGGFASVLGLNQNAKITNTTTDPIAGTIHIERQSCVIAPFGPTV